MRWIWIFWFESFVIVVVVFINNARECFSSEGVVTINGLKLQNLGLFRFMLGTDDLWTDLQKPHFLWTRDTVLGVSSEELSHERGSTAISSSNTHFIASKSIFIVNILNTWECSTQMTVLTDKNVSGMRIVAEFVW